MRLIEKVNKEGANPILFNLYQHTMVRSIRLALWLPKHVLSIFLCGVC